MTMADPLAQAIAHHQAGRLPEAEQLYRAILDAQPQHADANHRIGILAVQAGKPEMGLPYFKAALEADPSQGQYWLSYIDSLLQTGQHGNARLVLARGQERGLAGPEVEALLARVATEGQEDELFAVALARHLAGLLDEAEESYRQVLSLNPRHSYALGNLGDVIFSLGRPEEAEASCRSALEIKPDFAEAHNNLGNALKNLGRLEEAEASYRNALEVKPDSAMAHNNLGNALIDLARLEEAETSYRRALKIKPDYAEALCNLGNALKDLGRLEEAKTSFCRALEIKPDFAEAHNNLGNALKNLGRLEEAEASYRNALEVKPDSAMAHNNLGNALIDLARLEEAETSYRRALKIKPDYAEALCNLGNALKDLGRLEEAKTSFCRALEIKPDFAEAHNNLGNALKDLGRLEEAEASYRSALEVKPNFAMAHNNLGNALKDLGRLEEAEASYRSALEIKPDYAMAHNNLGNVLIDLGRLEEAETSCRSALEIKPDLVEVYCNLGNALKDLGRLETAEASYRRALEIKPDFAEAHNNLGNVLINLGRLKEAETSYRRTLEIKPDFAGAHNNLGNALIDLGRLEEAEASCHSALEIKPNFAEVYSTLAHALLDLWQLEAAKTACLRALAVSPHLQQARLNLALILFALGEMTEAWGHYEARWHCVEKGSFSPPRPFPQPRWQGEDLRGRCILVWGEQGIGDELVFFALLPELIRRGARCIVESDPRLQPLLARSFPAVETVERSHPPNPRCLAPDIDFQMPAASLAALLRPSLDGFQPLLPYLTPDPALVAAFRQAYGSGCLIGISWWSQNKRLGPRFSIPLSIWRPLLETKGCRFVSLQYGDRKAEIADSGLPLVVDDSVNPLTDLDRFAAQMAAMDLVISIDNSTVSMATALGKPVWNLVNTVPDWRIGQTGDTSPWHPTMRLFRQSDPGAWDPVVAKAAEALLKWRDHRQSENRGRSAVRSP
ncbi:Tfp pilus assembly protein PilF (modular protein) [Candidatus Terasakiella magnetica]|nr:Tfp pilus assembly protein PilF (modular protein) [Candidatus Terasakiella magnetica]